MIAAYRHPDRAAGRHAMTRLIMHAIRRYSRFAAHPAASSPPTRPSTPSSAQDPPRRASAPKAWTELELIRFLRVAQTVAVHPAAP